MQNSEGVHKTQLEPSCCSNLKLAMDIRLLPVREQGFTSLLLSHLAFSYAFKPGCLMRRNCLHTVRYSTRNNKMSEILTPVLQAACTYRYMYSCLDDLLTIYPVLFSKIEGDLHIGQLVNIGHPAVYQLGVVPTAILNLVVVSRSAIEMHALYLHSLSLQATFASCVALLTDHQF